MQVMLEPKHPPAPDATICSNESSYVGTKSVESCTFKEESKIKAYVDFTEFNKNYEKYLQSQQFDGRLNEKSSK